MKVKTKRAAESIRQGYLSLPDTDLVDLFEWLFERAVTNGYEGDFEIDLREKLGYEWESESLTGWGDRNGAELRSLITSMPITEFAHTGAGLPFYAGLLDASPLDNPKMLKEEHSFGELLVRSSNISESPFLLIKIKFEAFD